MRIYLDICCFNRPFDDQAQMRVRLEAEAKLAIQEEIRSGKIDLGWSYIMDLENEANPFDERKVSISGWRRIAAADVEESDEVLALAKALNEAGFNRIDSLHLACAISLQCDLFLSTDDGILKRNNLVTEIEIVNPVDYFTRGDD
jgi:hypothetical protein